MSSSKSCGQRTVRPLRCGVAILVFVTVCQAAKVQDDKLWQVFVAAALQAAGNQDYPKAEQFFVKALHEAENFGPNNVRVGSTLNYLGLVYRAEKKSSEAEAAYGRALVIMEAAYGPSVDVGNVNFNIAGVLFDQGRVADALPNLHNALAIYEKLLGDTSIKTAAALCLEGDAYRLLKRYPEAETVLRRCGDIREMNAGIESTDLADALYSLAQTYVGEGNFSAAEARLRLVEAIREKTLGITSLILAQTMEDHAAALRELGRDREAGKLTEMAAAIRRSRTSK